MIASGFQNAPISRLLVLGVVLTSVLATVTDTKYYLWIEIDPHLVKYAQYWRLLTWPLAYTNSTEVLFAAMTLYQLRVVERLWSSRKFLSFLLLTTPYTTLLPPLLVALVLRPLTLGRINYLPAGPTTIVFALLAQYHAAIPYIYKYRLSTTLPGTANNDQDYGMLLTSKATSYILPLQLALSQFPGSAIAAMLGWAVGVAYRRELLPGLARARVPAWLVGADVQRERFNDLRRRMEGEAGQASGANVQQPEGTARRRGVFGGMLEQLRIG